MKKRMGFVLSFAFVLCLCGCSNNASSVGMIGGADGPTAIVIASEMNWLYACGAAVAILAIALAAIIIHRNKKKK